MLDPESEHEALLQFLYLCPVGLIQMDGNGAVEMMNPLAIQILMPLLPSGEVDNLLGMLENYAPEISGAVKSFTLERGPICTDHRIQIGACNGRADPTVLALTLLQIYPGRLMGVLVDISDQVAQERKIRENEAWFAAIFNGVNDYAIYMVDAHGRIESWNLSGERVTGFSAEEMIGAAPPFASGPGQAGALELHLRLARRNGWHLEEGWCVRKDGTRFWSNSLISVLDSGASEPKYCVVMRDMTDRKRTLDELRRLATTDQLTGAFNRYQFFELAAAEEARWFRYGHDLSAIMVDADHFKKVNDTHGHGAGDIVLQHLVQLFRTALRDLDIIGRLGGEEFAILLPSTGIDGALVVAQRLCTSLAQTPVAIETGPLCITASFGVCALSQSVPDIASLLKAADGALYEAKRSGRNRVEVARGPLPSPVKSQLLTPA